MKLLITDANVLFDVINIGALPELFKLDFEICTTVFVIEEIKPESQRELVDPYIMSGKLTSYEFTAEEIEEIVNFESFLGLKRLTDKSVIWKSFHLKCTMLTGDRKMRDIAERIGVEVHGTIWVIDELLANGLISNNKAVKYYELLIETNSWLPIKEIKDRIKKLK